MGGFPLLGDISVEVIFFLVAAIIALINKLYEKTQEIRKKSQAQMRARDRDQLDLVRVGAEVAEAPPERPQPKPRTVAVRPPRKASVPPPRRTTRIVVPEVARLKRVRVKRPRSKVPRFVTRIRRDPEAMREAVVLREVLGRPVAMRGYRFPRR